ncbi:MAG: Crp/Fnr family transcriptional regulator [Ardenticatenales bacterium]|nr:Crp/Fnr family transcriptional regulator [Ardenticatenales bacterium]
MSRPMPERLAAFDLFAGLDAAAMDDIAAAAIERRLEAGEVFFRQAEPAERFFVLVDGRVRLVQVTPDGQQVVVSFIMPGEGFGLVAVLAGNVYPLTAEAMDPAVGYGWDGPTYKALMARHPELSMRSLGLVARRVHEFQARNRELSTERVERRIARTLIRLTTQSGTRQSDGVRIDLPLTRQDVAEMTGTTVYTVSRILAGWHEAGIIDAGRKRIVIRQPHSLVAIAEDLPPAR